MPEYIVNLPDELINIIELQGYSVNDYIQTMLINPLTKRMQVRLKNDALILVQNEIDNEVSIAIKKVKIKKVPVVVETVTTK